jgi:hypothetical protein
MNLLEQILEAVAKGVGDCAGCNDSNNETFEKWKALAMSNNPADHENLLKDIRMQVSWGA